MAHIVIIGAGPAGLTAAWELSKSGVPVTVIEKEPIPGGLCATNKIDDYQFDLGGHRFISKDQSLVDDIKNLLGERLVVKERKSVILFSDRKFEYPINLTDVITNSSPSENFRFAKDYVLAALSLSKPTAPEDSFDWWAEKSFGKSLNEFFFRPYTEKLWGIKASNLSSDWAGQRISLTSAKDAIIKSLVRRSKPRTYATKFLYPKGGIGEIFATMAEDIKRMGGKILYEMEPISFATKNDRVSSITALNKAGDKFELAADNFLSTMPLDKSVSLLTDNPVPALSYRSLRFLNITLKGVEDLSPYTWMYTPEADLVMTRIQEPKRRSIYSAPKRETSVMLEIPCHKGDDVWQMPDEKILERGLRDLKKLGIDINGNVDQYFSTYAPHAYPVYELGYKEKVSTLLGEVRRFTNCDTIGRQGFFRYIFMDSAMLMGRAWARRFIDGVSKNDVEEIGSEQEFIEATSIAR